MYEQERRAYEMSATCNQLRLRQDELRAVHNGADAPEVRVRDSEEVQYVTLRLRRLRAGDGRER